MKSTKIILLSFVFLFFLVSVSSVFATTYPYWIEHDENGNAINYVWTKVDLTANGDTTLCVSKQAGYSPNGNQVFDFFDDFDGSSLDTSKWLVHTKDSTYSVSNGKLIFDVSTANNFGGGNVVSKYSTNYNNVIITTLCMQENYYHTAPGMLVGMTISTPQYDDAYYGNIKQDFYWANLWMDDNNGNYFQDSYYDGSNNLHTLGSQVATVSGKYYLMSLKRIGSTSIALFDNIDDNTHYSLTLNNLPIKTYAYPALEVGDAYSGGGLKYFDYVFVRKYTANAPTVTVTDKGSYYKVDIHNNEATALTDYQIGIPVSSLGVTSESESLYITNQPPISGNQSVYPTPFYVGTNVTQQFNLVNNTNNQTIYLSATDENTSTLLYNESFVVYSNQSNATFKHSMVIPVSLAHHTLNFTTSSSVAGVLASQTYSVSNTPPTAPTSLTLNTPLYVNSTIIANASGSTDVDDDNLSYYYLFEDEAGTLLQNWSTTNTYTIPVSEAHKKIIVEAKAYDGFNYSSAISTSFTVSNTAPTATANFSDIVVDTATPQTIHISDLDNDPNFTIYLYNPDGTLNQKYSVDSQNPTINVTIPAETAYLGNQTLNCTVEDQYGGTYHFSIPVFVYGANVTVVFSDENGNPINLSAISYFSQDDVNSTPFYTSTPQRYLLKYLPTWYKVVIQNATMLKEFVVGPGTYTLHAYLINPFTTQYVVEPIQVVDVTNQPIYIINTKGFVTWSQVQDSLGKIYPYMELGQTYSIALKENGQLVTFGQITVLSNQLVVLYSKSISLPKLQKSLFQDVQVSYGFTSSGSIYLNYSDASQSTTKLIEYLYYLNTSNSSNQYVLFANQTYLNENTISSYFVVPSDVDSNSTQFKVEFQIWNKYGRNQIVKYFTRTNKIFLGVNAIAIGFFVFLGLLMLIGAFPVMFESIGLIIGGLALVLLSMLNLLPFMSPIVATSIGGLYTILGFFKMMANSGVTKQ